MRSIRIFLPPKLASGVCLTLEAPALHYLQHVMRCRAGDIVQVFNGQDGEWRAAFLPSGKSHGVLTVQSQTRTHRASPDLWLLAAPLRQGRSDAVIEKATELGIRRFCPLETRFSVADRINNERWTRIACEAAEQCERLDVPVIAPLQSLEHCLRDWPSERNIIYGDESGAAPMPAELLPNVRPGPLAALIGPEGGFAPEEFAALRALPFAHGISLGPRILRADTAAYALLTLLQAARGDWACKPAFRSSPAT